MIARIALVILTLGLLAGCSSSGKPLVLVDPKDPVWTLPMDHIDTAELPQ